MIWYLCLQVFSISLFWAGAVFCNTLHVIVSGMVSLVLIHGGRESSSMPSKSLLKASRYAVTTSFGSICYGSLFTAAIRTLRWEVFLQPLYFLPQCQCQCQLFLSFCMFVLNSIDVFQIRGIRSKIGKNECLLCCVDFLFHLVETLVRFFNKYAYVQVFLFI